MLWARSPTSPLAPPTTPMGSDGDKSVSERESSAKNPKKIENITKIENLTPSEVGDIVRSIGPSRIWNRYAEMVEENHLSGPKLSIIKSAELQSYGFSPEHASAVLRKVAAVKQNAHSREKNTDDVILTSDEKQALKSLKDLVTMATNNSIDEGDLDEDEHIVRKLRAAKRRIKSKFDAIHRALDIAQRQSFKQVDALAQSMVDSVAQNPAALSSVKLMKNMKKNQEQQLLLHTAESDGEKEAKKGGGHIKSKPTDGHIKSKPTDVGGGERGEEKLLTRSEERDVITALKRDVISPTSPYRATRLETGGGRQQLKAESTTPYSPPSSSSSPPPPPKAAASFCVTFHPAVNTLLRCTESRESLVSVALMEDNNGVMTWDPQNIGKHMNLSHERTSATTVETSFEESTVRASKGFSTDMHVWYLDCSCPKLKNGSFYWLCAGVMTADFDVSLPLFMQQGKAFGHRLDGNKDTKCYSMGKISGKDFKVRSTTVKLRFVLNCNEGSLQIQSMSQVNDSITITVPRKTKLFPWASLLEKGCSVRFVSGPRIAMDESIQNLSSIHSTTRQQQHTNSSCNFRSKRRSPRRRAISSPCYDDESSYHNNNNNNNRVSRRPLLNDSMASVRHSLDSSSPLVSTGTSSTIFAGLHAHRSLAWSHARSAKCFEISDRGAMATLTGSTGSIIGIDGWNKGVRTWELALESKELKRGAFWWARVGVALDGTQCEGRGCHHIPGKTFGHRLDGDQAAHTEQSFTLGIKAGVAFKIKSTMARLRMKLDHNNGSLTITDVLQPEHFLCINIPKGKRLYPWASLVNEGTSIRFVDGIDEIDEEGGHKDDKDDRNNVHGRRTTSPVVSPNTVKNFVKRQSRLVRQTNGLD